MNDFAVWLRARMKDLGVGQNELARRTGVTPSAINYYLNGDARSRKPVRPEEDKLILIARALKVPLDEARQAAGYAPLEKAEYPEEARILSFYRELPENVRRMIDIQIEALWENFSEGEEDQEVPVLVTETTMEVPPNENGRGQPDRGISDSRSLRRKAK